MSAIQEGSGNIPPQAFSQWNDPQGTKLISLNRDGSVYAFGGITFSDGTTQVTAGGSGTPAAPTKSVQFNNAGVFGGSGNFFWDNTNQYLGIAGPGAAAPQPGIAAGNGGPGITISGLVGTFAELEMHNGNSLGMELYTHRDANRQFTINMWRSRGTLSRP